jgi:hypothetical protein
MPDDRYFEPEVETMPRAALRALQEERILELVPYAYERSALVRMKWEEARVKPGDINSLADFTERVPFITKDDIRRFRDVAGDPFGGLLCTGYHDATTVFSISGTAAGTKDYAALDSKFGGGGYPGGDNLGGGSPSGWHSTTGTAGSGCRACARTRCTPACSGGRLTTSPGARRRAARSARS